MSTELVTVGADGRQDSSAQANSREVQTQRQAQRDQQQQHHQREQRRRLLPQPPASGSESLTGGDGTPSGCVASNQLSRRCHGRLPRSNYISSLRRLSIDDSRESDRLCSTPHVTNSTQIIRSRPNRRTQMAFLEDIPKYAFGTSHTIIKNVETSRNGQSGCSGESLQSTSLNSSGVKQSNCITEQEFKELVAEAVRLGCRHFDCAPLYKTQLLVGQCLVEIMKQVPRQQLFITSKLPPNMMRAEHIERSISKSIEEMQCCYLDLFLIHAPFATRHLSDDQHYPLDERAQLQMDQSEQVLENAWRKMVELKKRGFTRYIGLSNVNMEQLVRLHAIHPVDVVQNEYHIYNQNRDLFDYCEELDVHFEAYACFGNPTKSRNDSKPNCMSEPVLRRVAQANGLTVAQAIIQWIHNQPLSYVIKCDNKRQLEENLLATKLAQLPVESLMELDSLDRCCRVHTFTEHKGLEKHREYPFNDLALEFVNPFQQELRREQRWRQQQQNRNNIDPSTSHKRDSRPWQPAEPVTESRNTTTTTITTTNNNNDNYSKLKKIETRHEPTASTTTSIGLITEASTRTNNLNPVVPLGDFATATTPTPPSSTA